MSAYIGDGANPLAGVAYPRRGTALPAGSGIRACRLAGTDVADEGVPFRDIAEVIGRHLDLPVKGINGDQVAEHFGFLAPFAGLDDATSSALTQKTLDWHPEEKGLLADLDEGHYFAEEQR